MYNGGTMPLSGCKGTDFSRCNGLIYIKKYELKIFTRR